eukprot:15466086-Alexandrium_andersonii.AAC.1
MAPPSGVIRVRMLPEGACGSDQPASSVGQPATSRRSAPWLEWRRPPIACDEPAIFAVRCHVQAFEEWVRVQQA